MKDATTGTDTRDSRPLDRPLLGFDLAAEVASLRAEPAWAEHGRTAKTLAKSESFRLVVTIIRASGTIGDDDAYAPLAIQVLSGAARVEHHAEAVDLPAGGLAWLEAGGGWSVTALEDATLLLAITWPPERATHPAFI